MLYRARGLNWLYRQRTQYGNTQPTNSAGNNNESRLQPAMLSGRCTSGNTYNDVSDKLHPTVLVGVVIETNHDIDRKQYLV